MSFIWKQGKVKWAYYPVTTSTVLAADSLVTFASGLLVAATAGTAATAIEGINRKPIAATDSDYATARLVPIEIPVERFTVFEATTASAVAGDIGAEVDLTDALTVNRGASAVKAFKIIAVVNATTVRGYIKFLGSY